MAEYNVDVVEMEIIGCADCGMPFAVSEQFRSRRKSDGKTFYCPNGHSNYYPSGRGEKEKIKELEDSRNYFKNRMLHYKEEAEHKEYQRRGYKGALTRTKNAISRGQCPCCGDQFEDLADHMSSQHPDYKIKEEE